MNPDNNLKNLSQSPDSPFAITLAPIRYMGKNFYASGQVSKRGDSMLATGLVGREVDMKLAQEYYEYLYKLAPTNPQTLRMKNVLFPEIEGYI